MHPQTRAVLVEAARTLVSAEKGAADVPDPVLHALRGIVAYLAPNCTPEDIANGECPK